MFFLFVRYDVDIGKLENVKKIFDNLSMIQEFEDALPENQPDFPMEE